MSVHYNIHAHVFELNLSVCVYRVEVIEMPVEKVFIIGLHNERVSVTENRGLGGGRNRMKSI